MIGPLWKDIRAADLATLLNVLMGILAIAMALAGDTALAFHLIFAAIIVDGLDGAIARMGGGGGPLGSIIDTLADVVTFVVAPTVVILAHFGTGLLVVLTAFGFAAAGILRLARFQNLHSTPHFYGLSTPGGALVLGSAVLLPVSPPLVPVVAFVVAVLMMSRWPVPKLRGPIGVAGVLIIVANLALFFAAPQLSLYGLVAQLGFTAIYLVAGPAYLKGKATPSTSTEES